jgi:hypothetical protein
MRCMVFAVCLGVGSVLCDEASEWGLKWRLLKVVLVLMLV